MPETEITQRLLAEDGRVQGTFTAPASPRPQPLRLRALEDNGEELAFAHPYRVLQPGEGIVQRLAGTGVTRFFALTVAPDGTVWAGGDSRSALYRVTPGATTATLEGALLDNPAGR